MARYPAVPILQTYLQDSTVLFLDDGDREEEKLVAEKWRDKFNYSIQRNISHKGFYVIN